MQERRTGTRQTQYENRPLNLYLGHSWKTLDITPQPQPVTQHPMQINLGRHPAKPVKLRRTGIACQQQIERLEEIVMAEIIETRSPACQAQEFVSPIRAHLDIMGRFTDYLLEAMVGASYPSRVHGA